jgi:hypothetical protein
MIRNDEELKVVREQLSRAESALESLRRDVLPKNERMYRVMSESYVDTILELRGHIDTFLGINELPANAELAITLEGDRVGLGQTSAGAVTRFIDTFRRGLQSAVEMVEFASQPRTGRRRERWIESMCDLPIVGLSPGSVKVLLAEPTDQSLFSKENRESFQKALDLIFGGLHWADVSSVEDQDLPFQKLDPETRHAILALVTRLLPPRTGPIKQVSFLRRGIQGTERERESATLTRESRKRIRAAIEKMVPDTKIIEVTGVIRELDLDERSFSLRERNDGEPDQQWEYGPELEDAIKEFLDNRVTVTGSAELNRKNKEKLLADSIEPASDEADTPQNIP